MGNELQDELRGNRPDYVLGTHLEGWNGPPVVRFRAHESISRLFSFEITLRRLASEGPFAVHELLDAPATLRIASEGRWRQVHGIINEVEELERTSELTLYRVRLVPPAFRATQRIRCRTFVDKTLREIVVALLENRSVDHPNGYGGLAEKSSSTTPSVQPSFDSFASPLGFYRIDVAGTERLDDPKLRSYVVQYNESDFDLLARLLEEEGLSFVFDHQDDGVVLTITDHPASFSAFDRDKVIPFRGGLRGVGGRDRESVRVLRSRIKLRWGEVEMRDFDPARPQAPREGMAVDELALPDGSSKVPDTALYHRRLYPARDEAVTRPCVTPATVLQEQRAAERAMREAVGSVRVLEPGMRFTLRDDTGLRAEEDLVIVSVTTFATQLSPEDTILDDEPFGLSGRGHEGAVFECSFSVLSADLTFRPPLTTARPRIDGVHTAIVSADEIGGDPPEIHRNDEGCVRVRFPWDERVEKGVPSSTWVRVSQGWAGAGYGHLFVPRVGQEVLVAYLAGDPEKPLVVGRVHNAIQPVEYEKPTISTIKTKSSPNSDGFNELRFDDDAGNEEVFLHAQKNLNEVVLANHSTSVGGDQSNSVGGNQSNSVKGNRDHKVDGNETVTIAGHRTTDIASGESHTVVGGRATQITGLERHIANSTRITTVKGADRLGVLGQRSAQVTEDDTVDVVGMRTVNVAVSHKMTSPRHTINSDISFVATGGGATLELFPGAARLSSGGGASISLVGNKVLITGAVILVDADSSAKVCAPNVDLLGSGAHLALSGEINGTASAIKLNG